MKLAAASSQSCAECHRNLGAAGPGSQFANEILRFADGHPEFAALRSPRGKTPSDPGTVKLNHALHMKLIRRGPNGPMVQLECNDCHRPSASADSHWEYGDVNYAAATVSYTAAQQFEPGGSRGLPTKGPWSDRQLMAPVKFANACAGCHLLTFDKRFDGGVPHDNPEVIHAYLKRKFEGYIATHPAELREVQEPRRNLTGRVTEPVVRSVSTGEWVTEHVAVSEELLWHKTCAQCHAISTTSLQDVEIARWDAASERSGAVSRLQAKTTAGEVKLPTIAAARVKLQWLPHARFDHDAHTGFLCTGCHSNVWKSTESSDVLIPGIAVCRTCHADGAGHASAQCAECHTYHDWSKRKEVNPVFTLPALKTLRQ